jgi:hypothetical protein
MRQLHHSVAATWFAVFIATATMQAAEPIDIGSRRELFVDHHLIGSLSGVRLVLHRPKPREIVFRFDQPWEGLYSGANFACCRIHNGGRKKRSSRFLTVPRTVAEQIA